MRAEKSYKKAGKEVLKKQEKVVTEQQEKE